MTFARYVAVQLVAYAIDLGLFVLLFHGAALGPIVANVAAKTAAGAFAFRAHRGYTFRIERTTRIGREALKYALLLALNVPLASALLALLMLVVPSATVSKIAADVICVGLTFMLTKHGVFGVAGSPRSDDERAAADR
jgi:putative flippase GtrA